MNVHAWFVSKAFASEEFVSALEAKGVDLKALANIVKNYAEELGVRLEPEPKEPNV